MNRLTGRNSDGSVYVIGRDGMTHFAMSPGAFMPQNPTVEERLAAYEDTGLTPEEVKAMVSDEANRVRCKNCKHLDPGIIAGSYPYNVKCMCHKISFGIQTRYTGPDDYCSFAEREE